MAIEKFWSPVGPIAITSNGDSEGHIAVLSAKNLFVKQNVILKTDTTEFTNLEIKEVLSPTIVRLGPKDQPLTKKTDLSSVLLVDSPVLIAVRQSRSHIPEKEFIRATYAEEPIVAWRNVLVDYFGEYYTPENPLPVQLSDGSINIGTVNAELEVQLSHQADQPNPGDVPDSVQVGDGGEILQINPDGSINVQIVPVKLPGIANITCTDPDTEYSWSMPANTKRYRFRIRDGKAKAKLAYESGESGSNYWTVERGAWDGESEIDASDGLTLYFQVTHGNVIAEIQYWEF